MTYIKVNKEAFSLEQERWVKDVSIKILNQYILQTLIGKGKYGKVYLGYDRLNKRQVAIKELKNLQLAEQEAHIMKQYGRSKFLVTFYDFFINNDKAYIVMEYVKGKTFGKNFDSKGQKKDKKLSVQITINILEGLNSLHHKTGFYHDDVKPKNVMIYKDRPETIKIIDFNSSKKIENVDLMTKELLAYTAVIIVVSIIFEKAVMMLLHIPHSYTISSESETKES